MSKWNMSNLTEIPVLLHPKVRNTIQDQKKMYKTLKRIPHHSLCCQMNKLLCKKIPILVLQNENCNNAYVLWLQFWIYTWLPTYLMQSSIGQELHLLFFVLAYNQSHEIFYEHFIRLVWSLNCTEKTHSKFPLSFPQRLFEMWGVWGNCEINKVCREQVATT